MWAGREVGHSAPLSWSHRLCVGPQARMNECSAHELIRQQPSRLREGNPSVNHLYSEIGTGAHGVLGN